MPHCGLPQWGMKHAARRISRIGNCGGVVGVMLLSERELLRRISKDRVVLSQAALVACLGRGGSPVL
jgi:hypothetical protein